MRFRGVGAALRLRVEAADRLQRVAEEVEAHRLLRARREEVEDAAAHGVFAGLADGRRSAGSRCPRASGRGPSIGLTAAGDADSEPSRHEVAAGTRCSTALTVVSTICGVVGSPGQRAPASPSACATTAGVRRDAVVGQAVPGREIEQLDRRARRSGARARSRPGAGRRARRRAAAVRRLRREVGEHLADHAVGHRGEHGLARACEQPGQAAIDVDQRGGFLVHRISGGVSGGVKGEQAIEQRRAWPHPAPVRRRRSRRGCPGPASRAAPRRRRCPRRRARRHAHRQNGRAGGRFPSCPDASSGIEPAPTHGEVPGCFGDVGHDCGFSIAGWRRAGIVARRSRGRYSGSRRRCQGFGGRSGQ